MHHFYRHTDDGRNTLPIARPLVRSAKNYVQMPTQTHVTRYAYGSNRILFTFTTAETGPEAV